MRASKTVVQLEKMIGVASPQTLEVFEAARRDGAITAADVQRLFHAAAGRRSEALCEFFLRAGADINALDRHGGGALQRAVDDRSISFTRYLLNRGSDPNVQNMHGQTPLHRAHMGATIVQRPKEEALCRILLDAGANPEVVCKDFRVPLHNAVLDSNPETARILIRAGASPSFMPAQPYDGYLTPFQMAVDQGNPVMTRVFLRECEIDLEQKTLCGRSLFQLSRNPLIRQELRALRTSLDVENALGDQKALVGAPKKRNEGPVL